MFEIMKTIMLPKKEFWCIMGIIINLENQVIQILILIILKQLNMQMEVLVILIKKEIL